MKQIEPQLLFQMCAEKFVTQVCLTEQDFKTWPPASQMLLGNLSELKGKLWHMGRQRTSLTGKSQKNMVMTLTFPSPHNFMFCHFLKTFHHYLLSKKKVSPRQLWKKKQEHSFFPPHPVLMPQLNK